LKYTEDIKEFENSILEMLELFSNDDCRAEQAVLARDL
jgi:hypothetical protein